MIVPKVLRAVTVLAAGGSLAAGTTSTTQRDAVAGSPNSPTTVWRVEGEGYARPAASADAAYFLTARHEVVAVDAHSGAVRWRHDTLEPGPSTFGAGVALAGPVVVAGDYNLIAFDRVTGALRWRFVPAIGYGPGIFLGRSTSSLVLAGSPAGRVYALSALSGDLVWSAAIEKDGRTTVFQPVTYGNDIAVTYTSFTAPPSGGVAVLDLASGRERWRARFPLSDPAVGTSAAGGPAMSDDLVIATSADGTIHAFDRRNGSTRWTLPPISDALSFGAPPGTTLGLPTGPLPQLPMPAATDFRPLAVAGRTLIAGSLKSHVIAYDLMSRRERWRHRNVSSGSVLFAVASDTRDVYVPYASGRQIAIDILSGVERWRTDARGGFYWPAAAVDDRVFLAGSKGGFVALQR